MSVLKIKNSQGEFEPVLTIDPSQEVADWMHGNAADTIDGWLDDNIAQETGYVLDRSLTANNAAAPADMVGDISIAVNNLTTEDSPIDLTKYPVYNCTVRDSNLLNVSGTDYQSVQIPTHSMSDSISVTASSGKTAIVCFFKQSLPASPTHGMNVTTYFSTGETGRHVIDEGETATLAVPSDAVYIIVGILSGGQSVAPSSISAHNMLFSTMSDSTIASLAAASGGDIHDAFTIDGAVKISDGTDFGTSVIRSIYYRTPYIFVRKGERITVNGLYSLITVAMLAVYDLDKVFDAAASKAGNGDSVKNNFSFVMPYDGYVRFSSKKSTMDETSIYISTNKKTLNLLVLGNSFAQDVFAYLPPVLNELLPEYNITYGIAYSGSTGIQGHIDMYNDSTPYTWFNLWRPGAAKWTRYAGGGVNEKTLAQILDLAQWDVIYVQPNGALAEVESKVVAPGRNLIRLLNTLINRQFIVLMGQWLTESNEYLPDMKQAMDTVRAKLGVNSIIPIGTGIANARSNATLNALGDSGKMLYDGQHQQAGLPALISTYVIANHILKLLGDETRSVYNSSFIPTTENCIAINAYKTEGMVRPYPMTHGESVGVTDTNIRAAQEISVLAVNNPFVVSDCSDIL